MRLPLLALLALLELLLLLALLRLAADAHTDMRGDATKHHAHLP